MRRLNPGQGAGRCPCCWRWPRSRLRPRQKTLRVGPEEQYKLPSHASKAAKDGDTVEIVAGEYLGDVALWQASNLTIRGVGGRPHLMAAGKSYNGKGLWVVRGHNVTIENIEISGVKVGDNNGAAVRHNGGDLVLRKVYFHDNQNGLLTGHNKQAEILVEYSEFANNGHGQGYTHNIYVGDVRKFSLLSSYVHHAKVGHQVKSLAAENRILYNRLMDEEDGNSSYLIDLPWGGYSVVMGNVIQQSKRAPNHRMVSYAAGSLNPQRRNALYMVHNTLVNDRSGGNFIWARDGDYPVIIANNLFYGNGTFYVGPGEILQSRRAGVADMPRRRDYDYRLGIGAAGIDEAVPVKTEEGEPLVPRWVYDHPANRDVRLDDGKPDVGAFEFKPIVLYEKKERAADKDYEREYQELVRDVLREE